MSDSILNAVDLIKHHYYPGFSAEALIYKNDDYSFRELSLIPEAWDPNYRWVFSITKGGLIKVADIRNPKTAKVRSYWIKLEDFHCMGTLFTIYTSRLDWFIENVFGESMFTREIAEQLINAADKDERDAIIEKCFTPICDKMSPEQWHDVMTARGKFVEMQLLFDVSAKYGNIENLRQIFVTDFTEYINNLMEEQDPGPTSRKTQITLKFDINDWERFVGTKHNPELLTKRDYRDLYE